MSNMLKHDLGSPVVPQQVHDVRFTFAAAEKGKRDPLELRGMNAREQRLEDRHGDMAVASFSGNGRMVTVTVARRGNRIFFSGANWQPPYRDPEKGNATRAPVVQYDTASRSRQWKLQSIFSCCDMVQFLKNILVTPAISLREYKVAILKQRKKQSDPRGDCGDSQLEEPLLTHLPDVEPHNSPQLKCRDICHKFVLPGMKSPSPSRLISSSGLGIWECGVDVCT
ncbi:hypothetical protein DFH06DRAFT_1120744 [Mycena polygramma]|nr:hypothetical protein DFH06DRAFT_1120744 [Mycena polygramma]